MSFSLIGLCGLVFVKFGIQISLKKLKWKPMWRQLTLTYAIKWRCVMVGWKPNAMCIVRECKE